MKHAIWVLGLLLASLGATATPAQQATNVPFYCQAATAANVPLSWSMFSCRGLDFADGTTLIFGTQLELYTGSYEVGPYNVTQSLTSFTQPNPTSCPRTGCPSDTVPGTLSVNYSGTDQQGNPHSGTYSGTWENVQVCGGRSCWYHPVLLSLTLTINQ